jgi:Ser/Thr protein kinase RdoA (MazF antagonist)
MDDGRIYVLYEWAEGEDFNASHPYAYYEGGAYLGEFHRAVADYHDPLFPSPKGGVGELWRNEIIQRMELLIESPCPTVWLERLEEVLHVGHPPSAGLPTCIVHGDFRAQNIRFRRGRGRAILDLDASVYGTRMADLAYTLMFYTAVYFGGPMTEEQTLQLLSAYHELASITLEERAALPAWMYLALWRGVSLWLTLHYCYEYPSRVLSWVRLFAEKTAWLDDRLQSIREWLRAQS